MAVTLPVYRTRTYRTLRAMVESGAVHPVREVADETGQPPRIMLNLNDTYAFACADTYDATAEFDRVAEIYERFGWNAVCTWVAVKRGHDYDESILGYYDDAFADRHEAMKVTLALEGYFS